MSNHSNLITNFCNWIAVIGHLYYIILYYIILYYIIDYYDFFIIISNQPRLERSAVGKLITVPAMTSEERKELRERPGGEEEMQGRQVRFDISCLSRFPGGDSDMKMTVGLVIPFR